jgi:WD40-like Beta Propeller Repeat
MRPLLVLVLALAGVAVGGALVIGRHDQAGTDVASAATPQRVVFASGDAVHEVDLSGRHRRILVAGAFALRAVQGIAPLPDGSVVLGEKQRLIRYDAAGRRVADLGPGVGPSASPDGKRLALVVSDDFMSQIWVMNLDGSERKQLTTSDGYNVSPGWSPDGSTILYTNFAPGAADADTPESWLETVAADGGQPARLTSTKLDLIGRYSPDGSWIAFMSERDRVKDDCGNRQCFFDYLYVMRADGSDAHRVTRDPLFDAPVFATATTIVYGRHADGYDELYRIELDGRCRARITRDVLLDEEAAVPTPCA